MPIKRAATATDLPPEASDAEVVDESTATLDVAVLGGQTVAPGDRVELEVVSVDDENGTLTVKYPKPEKTTGSSIEAATAVFDEQES